MRVRTVRQIALAFLLTAGLAAWPGCGGSETPTDGTPPTAIDKIEKSASKALENVEAAGAKAVEGTGKAIEGAGQKLETSGKDAVKEHVGDKASEIVEGAGKGLEKAGGKIQEAVKKKD